jgi:oleate hydratase
MRQALGNRVSVKFDLIGDQTPRNAQAMSWCEANGVDYIFGLAGNAVLDRLVEPAADDIRVRRAEGQLAILRGFAEIRYAAKSWAGSAALWRGSRPAQARRTRCFRRGIDIRYAVTSLKTGDAGHIYETVYCARGQAENLIKQHKAQTASDPTSCHSPLANQMRLILHTAAYWLLLDVRDQVPSWHPLRHSEFTSIRLHLLKIAGRIVETASRIRVALASYCPEAELFSFSEHNGEKTVTSIAYERDGKAGEIAVDAGDYVLITLRSMTEAPSLDGMDTAPVLKGKADGGTWTLWEKIAEGRPEFGCPSVFDDHIGESNWVSFTTTLHDDAFLRIVRDLTGNVPGEGGLITFLESNWVASIVIPHQPHLIGQPGDVSVFWGYGLSVDEPGNFVKKPMPACTGREIMTEVLGHLHAEADASKILETSICIPCMMPFVTSQFLRRAKGDRPQVVPKGSQNLALMGQFCELPDDVVFTVEYSIRLHPRGSSWRLCAARPEQGTPAVFCIRASPDSAAAML